MSPSDKHVVWLSGTITTPPFSKAARRIVEIFLKKTRRTPDGVMAVCKARLRRYDDH